MTGRISGKISLSLRVNKPLENPFILGSLILGWSVNLVYSLVTIQFGHGANVNYYSLLKGVFARSVFQPVINNAVFFNYHCANGDGVKNPDNGFQTNSVCFS